MMQKLKSNYIYIILMFLITIPVFVIAFYAFPNFDDYAYSIDTYHVVLNGGNMFDLMVAAFNTSMEFMQTWQGLYTSAFLLALQPGIFGEQFYFITVIVIVASLFIGIYLLIKSVNKYIFKNRNNHIFLTILVLFFLIQTMPDPYEAFYWYNGAVNYLFFLGLLFVVWAEYISLYNNQKENVFRLILLSVLMFLLSGGNHITAFAGLFVGFIVVIVSFIKKKKRLLIIPFIIGLIGFVYNITSPGTAIRAGALGMDADFVGTIIETFRKSFGFLSDFTSFSLILFIILMLCCLYPSIREWKIVISKKMLVIPLLSYILLCGMYSIVYFATGSFGAGRVYNTIYVIYVILLLINMVLLLKYLLNKKIINLGKINSKLKFVFPIIVIVFVGFFGNNVYYNSTTYEAIRELTSGEAKTFKVEQQSRFDKYTNKKIDEVIVKPLTAKPYLLFGTEACIITEDNNCSNNAVNDYFDKKVIGMKE